MISELKLYFFFLLLLLSSCRRDDSPVSDYSPPEFSQKITGSLSGSEINEASGIAPSYKNKGGYWVHNDGGDSPRVFLIDSTGAIKSIVILDKIINRDWEDIATYKDPVSGKSYVYLAETGDNFKQFNTKHIYRFEEPLINLNSSTMEITVKNIERLNFTYASGNKDAETLLVDPITSDIFIITKWEKKVELYQIPSNFDTGDTLVLDKISTVPGSLIVGGDISPDGSEILLKSYTQIFYWKRTDSPIPAILQQEGQGIEYKQEKQEEAICWTENGKNFITVSECTDEGDCHLNYYTRK